MLQFQKNYIKMYLKSCEIFVNFIIVDQYNFTFDIWAIPSLGLKPFLNLR